MASMGSIDIKLQAEQLYKDKGGTER